MKTPDTMLLNCMFWLTEISMYRCRIKAMRKQMHHLTSKLFNDESHEKQHLSIMQRIQIACNKLNHAESKIIYITKKHTNSVSYEPQEVTRHLLDNDEDLFENMRNFYNLFISLQKNIYSFLEDSPANNSYTTTKDLLIGQALQEQPTYSY